MDERFARGIREERGKRSWETDIAMPYHILDVFGSSDLTPAAFGVAVGGGLLSGWGTHSNDPEEFMTAGTDGVQINTPGIYFVSAHIPIKQMTPVASRAAQMWITVPSGRCWDRRWIEDFGALGFLSAHAGDSSSTHTGGSVLRASGLYECFDELLQVGVAHNEPTNNMRTAQRHFEVFKVNDP